MNDDRDQIIHPIRVDGVVGSVEQPQLQGENNSVGNLLKWIMHEMLAEASEMIVTFMCLLYCSTYLNLFKCSARIVGNLLTLILLWAS